MIALTPAETELVLATLDVPADLRDRLAAAGAERVLDGEEVDLLVELATDRLMIGGFDASYRPTVEGAALERLIDRLVAEDADAGPT
jgi:hypothetical protein